MDAIPACSPPLGIDLVDKPIPREEKTARPADNLPERSLKRTPDSDADSWIKDESPLVDGDDPSLALVGLHPFMALERCEEGF